MTCQFAQWKLEGSFIRFEIDESCFYLILNYEKTQARKKICGCFCTCSIAKCVLVCESESDCYHTAVSQSAPPHAAACPSLGLLPRQKVCVLTHCVQEALRGGIHPITLQQGRVRRMIFPVGMERVNFTVTAASTELMCLWFLQLVARTCPHSSIQEDNEGFAHIQIYSGSKSLEMLEICMIFLKVA